MGSFFKEEGSYEKHRKTKELQKVKVREIELFSVEATLLEFMSTCREDVKMDPEYMSIYYPNVDQIYDERGLTLVSKPFVNWGKLL